MRGFAKRWVNRALRPLGLQVVATQDDERAALVDLLHARGIDHVIDVGANEGQFARQLLDKGYRGRIDCIEPLETAHVALSRSFRNHAQVSVLSRTAVGASKGTTQINVAGNSVSSSILPMEAAHQVAAPRSRYEGSQAVELTTLDSLYLTREGFAAERTLLKIDTQGFEGHVLDGAGGILPQLAGVLIELSTTSLYTGQSRWEDLHERLCAAGFELWDLLPDFRDRNSGRLLQFDGLYMHES